MCGGSWQTATSASPCNRDYRYRGVDLATRNRPTRPRFRRTRASDTTVRSCRHASRRTNAAPSASGCPAGRSRSSHVRVDDTIDTPCPPTSIRCGFAACRRSVRGMRGSATWTPWRGRRLESWRIPGARATNGCVHRGEVPSGVLLWMRARGATSHAHDISVHLCGRFRNAS